VGNAEPLRGQLNVPYESFVANTEGYPEMNHSLAFAVEDGAVLARSLDLLSLEYPLLIIGEDLKLSTGLMNVCAIRSVDEEMERRGWWQVENVVNN
jgi:hypothetical protein